MVSRSPDFGRQLLHPARTRCDHHEANRARRRRNVEAWRGLGGMADLHTRKLIEQARRNRELARATRRASNACVKDSKRLIRESRELLANHRAIQAGLTRLASDVASRAHRPQENSRFFGKHAEVFSFQMSSHPSRTLPFSFLPLPPLSPARHFLIL